MFKELPNDKSHKYTVVVEEGATSYGAFVPDLLGCVAVAETREEVLQLIQEAMDFHLAGLKEDGEAIPKPHCEFTQVEVRVA